MLVWGADQSISSGILSPALLFSHVFANTQDANMYEKFMIIDDKI